MIKRMISEALGGIPIKVDTETGIVTVKDYKKFGDKGWVKYSPEEVDVIRDSTGEIAPRVHNIKSIFFSFIKPGSIKSRPNEVSTISN